MVKNIWHFSEIRPKEKKKDKLVVLGIDFGFRYNGYEAHILVF